MPCTLTDPVVGARPSRVLLIDDDPNLTEIVSALLAAFGYPLVVAPLLLVASASPAVAQSELLEAGRTRPWASRSPAPTTGLCTMRPRRSRDRASISSAPSTPSPCPSPCSRLLATSGSPRPTSRYRTTTLGPSYR